MHRVHRLLRTAHFRLAALYVGLFAVSAVSLGAATFMAVRSALLQQIAARIETEHSFLQAEYRAGGLDRLLAAVRVRGRGPRALDYLVQTAAGTKLAGEMPAVRALHPGWSTIDNPSAREDDGQPEAVHALTSDLGDGLLLAVGDDQERIAEVGEAVAKAFGWTVGLAAALGIGGGVVLSRASLRRVDSISGTAEAIIAGDLSRRMPVNGTGDDLDRLSGTLNRMLDRIEALMTSLHQVSSDVAHDLRTPLTRLYQRLEDARTHARSVGEYEASIDGAIREAEGLLETFSALLRIAQVEGTPRGGVRRVNLSAIMDAVADAYRPDAEDGGHTLSVDVAPEVFVQGDQELLTQALSNLVENALRHTPAGTRVRIGLVRQQGLGPCLSVQDDGPGAAAAELPRLIHRFYRSERSRTTPGNGLGLSLVAAVASMHGAALQLDDAEPGLRVRMLFPPHPTA